LDAAFDAATESVASSTDDFVHSLARSDAPWCVRGGAKAAAVGTFASYDADAPAASAATAEPAEITLVIDGKPVKNPLTEAIVLAQITVAGDTRLDEAKRLLDEAKAVRRRARQTNASQHGPAFRLRQHCDLRLPGKPTVLSEVDQGQAAEIVAQYQIGDAGDGVAAWRARAARQCRSREGGRRSLPVGNVGARIFARLHADQEIGGFWRQLQTAKIPNS
jgi:hypothetical protein